jgi:putative transposase
MIVNCINAHRSEFGVEPICAVLSEIDPDNWKVSPSTYYAARARPISARAISEVVTKVAIFTVWQANYEVYGVRKMWKAMRRAGSDVGRDQVARLMSELGIAGARRGKRVRTTRPDDTAVRPPDLVCRDFTATGPNQLWVTDLTYVPTWSGMVYVSFITDVFSRMIVGWRRRDAPAHARQRLLRETRRTRQPFRIDLRVLHVLRHHHRVQAHPPPPTRRRR